MMSDKIDTISRDLNKETVLQHVGRPSRGTWPAPVNIPAYRASTITFADMASYEDPQNRDKGLAYGRVGTPSSVALETAMSELEGGYGSVSYPSGLAAITGALQSHLSMGSHVLLPDSLYGSARTFCERQFPRQGIRFDYYPAGAGNAIGEYITANTRVVYVESPGSATFEIQDVPAIAQVAHAAGAIVIMDNTWATPLLFPALQHGVDIVVYSATKYLSGHSDAMLGLCVCKKNTFEKVRLTADDFGNAVGSEEVYLTLRGIRTLDLRLERHGRNASQLSRYFESRSEVERVLFPGSPGALGHALWKRDFLGASGLFSIVLTSDFAHKASRFIDSLTLFSIGGSWGGYESMVKPFLPLEQRRFGDWNGKSIIRFHAGLENAGDLILDIEKAFEVAAHG
ncbi:MULTISPECIES: cystathionine beta-lyase [Rhizobium/Agrobacterium group]|uniref:Putative cystathionine beta-lyase n=1 Tax=Agrobacterium tumefaciens str. Kerr 14 TaxID=1183424 RepID=A0A1S7SDC1_AGRTU|nr:MULTISPECIES: cystathionine beta-lyase [Rhizobium/Agrobacterium group]NTF97802.1 cystathionine beta-lyase [Rhizobium rhizogenes]CUX67046.1 putative cystathionine beta-lyase [Agrobacterium tumefaciens str. Kerr 14]